MSNSGRFDKVSLKKVRDYWNARPCNIRHSNSPVGSRKYFEENEARRYFVEPHIRRFAQFDKWAGKRVLDIGCGIGVDTINFARAGAMVTAVELSEESLKLARRQAKIFGLEDRIKFYQADAEHLSDVVPKKAYDLIYSMGVIHHTPHPEAVVRQVRRHYVHDKSIFKLMVYNRHSWRVLNILFAEAHGQFWRLDEFIARNSEAQSGSPVTYTYTRDSVRRLLHGFDILDEEVDFIFPYRVRDYIQYRYVKKWYLRHLPGPVFRMLEHKLGWHLLITATPEKA